MVLPRVRWDVHLSFHPRYQPVAKQIMNWLTEQDLRLCTVCVVYGSTTVTGCIQNSTVMLACLSEEYMESNRCMAELQLAVKHDVRIVTIWLGDNPTDSAFDLVGRVQHHFPARADDDVFNRVMLSLTQDIRACVGGKIMAEAQNEFQDMSSMFRQEINVSRASIAIVGQDCRAKDELVQIVLGARYHSIVDVSPRQNNRMRFERQTLAYNTNTGEVREKHRDDILLDFLCHFYVRCQSEKTNKKVVKKKRLVKKSSKVPVRRKSSTTSVTTTTSEVITPPVIIGESCFERLPTETEYLSKEVQGHQEGLCHESPVLLKKTLRVDEDGDFKEMERLIVENLDESIECGEVMESIPKSARSVKEGEVTVVEVHQNEVAGSMTLKPVGSVSSEVTVVEQEGEMLITEFEQEGGNVITEIQEEGAKVITVEKTIPPDREEEVINIIEELITNLETRTEKRLLVGSSSEDPDVVVEGVQMIQKSADDDGSETITTEYKEEFEDSLEIKTSCKDEVCASSQAPKKKAATKDTTKKKGAQKSKIQDSKLSSKTNKKTSSPENKAKTTKGSRKVSLSSPESKTKTTKGSRKVSLSSPESKTKTLQKLAEDSKLPKPVAKATKKKSKATSKPEGTKSNLIRSKAESDLTRSDSTDSVLSECDSSEEQYFKEIYLILRQTQVYQKFVELLLTNAPSVYRRSDQFQREALIDLFQVHGNAYYNTHNTIIPRNSSFLIVSHRQDSAVSPNVEPSTPSADNNSFESLSQLQGEYARKFWRTACEESKTKYMYVHGSDRLNIHSNVQYINALESGNNTAIIRYHNKSKEDLQNRIFSSTVTAQSFPFGFLLFEILMNNEKSQFIKFKRLQFLNRLCRLGRISEEALQTHLVDNFNILPPQIYDESSQVNFVVSAPDKFVAFLQKLMNASTTNNTNNHQAVMRQSINELCSTCRFHDDGELRMFLRWIVMYLGHFGLVNLTTTTSVESAEDLNKLEWVLTQTEEWKFQDTMEKDSFQRMSSAHASMHNGSFCVMGDDCRGKNELLALFNFTTGAMVEAPAEKGFRFGRLMCAMNINTKEVKRASVYEVLLRMLCSLYMRSKAQKRVIKNGSNSIPISVGKDEVSSTNVVTKRKRVIEYQGQNISNTEKNSVQENHMSGTEITAGEDVSVRSAQNDIEFLREAASKTRVYSEFLSMLKTDTTAVEKLSDRFDNEVYFNILKTCGGKEFAGYHEFLTPSDTTHLVVSEDNSKGGQQSASNKDDVLVSSRKSKNMYSKFKYLAEMKQGDNRSIVLEERSKSDALQFVADSVAREDSVSLEAVLLAMIVSSSEDALMTHRSYDTLLKRCAKTESGREKLERFLSENNLLLTFENLSKISTEEDNTKVWFSEGENEERLTKVKHDISYEEEEKATKDKSSHEEEEAQNYAEYVITDPARFADLLAACLNPIVANQRAVAMAMKEGLTRICTQGSEMSAKLRWILRVLQRMGCIEDLGMLDLQGKEDIDMKQLDAVTWKFPHAQQDVSLQQDFSLPGALLRDREISSLVDGVISRGMSESRRLLETTLARFRRDVFLLLAGRMRKQDEKLDKLTRIVSEIQRSGVCDVPWKMDVNQQAMEQNFDQLKRERQSQFQQCYDSLCKAFDTVNCNVKRGEKTISRLAKQFKTSAREIVNEEQITREKLSERIDQSISQQSKKIDALNETFCQCRFELATQMNVQAEEHDEMLSFLEELLALFHRETYTESISKEDLVQRFLQELPYFGDAERGSLFSDFVRMSQESIAVRRANLAVVGDDGYGKQEVMDIVRGTRFANKHMSQDEFCFRRTLFSVTKTTRMLRERNVDDIILSMLCSIYDDCHPDNVFLVDDDNDNKENYYRCDDIEPKYKPAKEIFDLVKETPIYKRFLTMLKNEPTLVRRKAKEVEEEDYMSLFTTNGTEYFTNQQSLLPDRCFYLIVNSQSASTPQSASALKTASTPQSASALKTASTLQGASTPLIASVEQTSGVVSEGKQDQESDDNLVSTTENYWTSVCELNDSQYTIVHAKETKSLYSNVRHVVSCKGRHEYQNTPMHNKNRSEAKKLLTETSFYGSEVPFRYLALVLLLKNQRCPFMRRSRFDELKAHCSQLDPRDDDASKMESFLVGNLLVISPQVDEGIIPLEEQYVIVDPDRFISLLNVCMNLQKQQRPANVVMREAIQEMCLQDGPVDKKELSTLLRWLVTCFHMFGIVVDLDVFFDTLQLSNLSGIEWLVPSNRPEEPKSSLELIGELFLSFETEKFKGNLLFHRQLFHMIVAVFLKNKRILIISLSRYCLVFDSFYGVECQLRLRCLRSPSTGECSYQLSLGQTQHEDHYGCNKTRKRLIRAVRHVLRYCFRTQVEVFTRYAYMCNGALIEYRIVDGMPPHCIQVWFAGHSVVNGDRGCRVLLLDGGGEQTVIEAVTLMLIQYVVYLHSAPLRNRKHMSLNHFLESSKKCFHMKKTKGYPQIHELFDLVIGNATGALLATCLARKQYDPLRIVYDFIADEPRKPEDWLIDVFRTPIQKIFSQRMTVIEKRLEQRFKTDQKKVHPSVPLLAVMNETTNKQENETEEDQINSLSIEGWHSRRNFFEKVVTRYRHGHEQSNANCPIVEGLNLVQEIAKLEGGDGKSKSTIDDCILSLGCGEDLEMDHSRPLHELGWSSNTHCILSHNDHIWRDHSEETQAIRLNPGRVFPLRQNCPKKMVSSYLETLRDSPGRRSGFTIPYGGLAQFPVVGFELDGIASEYDAKSARHWCHADSANELLVEFYVSIEAARLVVNGNFVEMRFSDGSLLTVTARKDALPPLKIFCARLQGNLLKLTLTHTSRYGEVIKVNVEEDETTLAYFVARVDGARSFRNEVERAATRVYAKNLKLAHAGSYACWQDNDLDYGTKYAEMTLRFSLSCVSGHACLVNCVYNGDKCDRRRERVSSCTHCMESMRSVHCDTIASEQNNKEKECFPYCQTCVKSLDSKNTAVKKSTVNVECLSLSLSGTDVTLTEYSFDNRQDVCDVTLKVRCKRWQVPHFDVNLKYKDVHLTGSPMTVKNTGKTLGVLQRYFRPSVMQHATYDFLTMDDVSKVNAKPKQKLCNEQLVLRYARKYKAKVILLSFDRAQNEYYIRLPHHVILPENDIIEKVAYIKYEDVLQDNETGILQEAHSLKSKVKGSLVKVFAREIRGLLADCDESSDCIGEKLRGKMEEEKERMKLMFGETKNSKLEVELICLAELYRTRVVLLSFDHKLQQHVIKRPHDVIMPPSNALVDNTLFMYWDDIL